MMVRLKKDEFFANSSNKQKFVYLLGEMLEVAGFSVHHATGDADLLIVQAAIQSFRQNPTTLVGDDTDLLILLCHHADMDSPHERFLRSEPKQRLKNVLKVWNVKKTKSSLGLQVCKNLLFVHAILGCDTTSSVFGIGMGAALKKIQTNKAFQEQAEVFNRTDALGDDVVAGENEMLTFYNNNINDSLDACHVLLKGCHWNGICTS